jgi:type IV pilus biogenesis protein CpaD/CtpE
MSGLSVVALAAPVLLAGCGGGEADAEWRPGAATRGNIAALAANPDDLYLPRREAPRDAVRRDAVIGHYAQRRADAPAGEAGAKP